MDKIFIVGAIIIVAIAIIIVLSLTISDNSTKNLNIPTVTISCNGSQTPQPIDLPSSFPFNLETTTLGSGAYTLLYYSDPECTNLIDVYYGVTQSYPQQINPNNSSQIKGIQYIFLCSKVDTPISTSTPSPVSINPYLPYVFRNISSSNLIVMLTGVEGSQTLPTITANSTGFPNPPLGWNSYTATFSP
jgi:hypothetical protein